MMRKVEKNVNGFSLTIHSVGGVNYVDIAELGNLLKTMLVPLKSITVVAKEEKHTTKELALMILKAEEQRDVEFMALNDLIDSISK